MATNKDSGGQAAAAATPATGTAAERAVQRKRVSEVEYLNLQDEELPDESASASCSAQISSPGQQQIRPLPGTATFDSGPVAHSSRGSSIISERQNRASHHGSLQPLASNDSLSAHQLAHNGSAGRTSQLTRNLIKTVLASALCSSFQHGYNGGVVNAPAKLISQFINETYFERHSVEASDAEIDFIFSLMVSIYCIGGCLGALLTALVGDHIGRKQGLLYNNILVMLACPMMASAKWLSSYELLILGRLLIGINAGLNAGLTSLYLNEISPNNLRGTFGTVYQLIITISIFISNIFGLPQLLGTDKLWPLLFALPILPALTMLITLPKCSESPRFLLLNQGHELQAQQALAWFRQTGDVQDEMDELRHENELSKLLPVVSMNEMLNQPRLRRPLTIAIVIMLSQQLSGINAILFFSTSIFLSAGLKEDKAILATLGMSLVNCLMTGVSLLLIERAGRRTLHMTGLLGMACTCLILGLCLGGTEAGPSGHGARLWAVISIYVFIIMFASGPGSIPWFLVAELFPSNARSQATSVAVAVNWLANFSVSLCFLPLSNILHGHTFFVFAFLLVIFYLFTYYKVPETKGTSPEEISALFTH